MTLATARRAIETLFREHKAQLRYCLRLTLAGLTAFGLAQFGNFPLHGLWAVLTAIVVTQMSIGGSLQATAEYVVGTLCGAIYASAIALLVPHSTMATLTAAMALSIAPLALLASFNSKFRVAPFTAVLVLFVANEFHQGPLVSATYRVLEVVLGGTTAIVVSLLVLPERAHDAALQEACQILDRMAEILPELLAGLTRQLDVEAMNRLQDELGGAVIRFQTVAAEIKSERLTSFAHESDHAPLSRTLLRLRHDFVILGRAAAAPLPPMFAKRLGPLLIDLGTCTKANLGRSAEALASRTPPSSADALDKAYETYASAVAELRREGLTRGLDAHEVEQVFALGFAIEQLHRDLGDLRRCVIESARPSSRKAKFAAPA